MQPLYPLTFDLAQLTRDYLWGGSTLKPLVPDYPANQPLAELWVVSDRPKEDRVGTIANGPLAGTTLRQLVQTRSDELLGHVAPVNGKFPLLIKLLDPTQAFSLQVHPPEVVAAEFGHESKTEAWVCLPGTQPTATVVAGLKPGINRSQIERALRTGADLEPLLHHLPVRPGDCLFVPAGRLHSASAGCLIYEVQTNSNTTYRVFDWNRIDPSTGQPRALNITGALRSIDWSDVKPTLATPTIRTEQGAMVETLVDCPLFTLERWTISEETVHSPETARSFDVITPVDRSVTIHSISSVLPLKPLMTALLPASLMTYSIVPSGLTTYLRTFVRFD